MTLRQIASFVLVILVFAGVAFSEDPKATLSSASGDVVLGDGPDATPLEPGQEVPEGAALNLDKGAKATVVFEDGSEMHLVGPARVKVVAMSPGHRRIDLSKGRISSFSGGDTITGIHTPQDAFLALQNGTVGVNVKDGQATFNLFDGSNAKVVDLSGDEQKIVELAPNTPYVVGGPPPAAPDVWGPGTDNIRRIKVGDRLILLSPKDGFDVTSTETGGTTLTCTLSEDLFGSVQLGMHTVFYVAGGETINLDSAGNVITTNSAVHTQFTALDIRG
ncbi:MAG: hypothetical protein ABFS86_11265, partial [Planctomycetota bacterium]